MQKHLSLLCSILLLTANCSLLLSQAPQKINYQAVARNASGALLVSTPIKARYTVHNLTTGGIILYQETHSGITTNSFGLFTAAIGGGTPNTGSFAAINWGSGDKYLQLEVEINNSGTFIDMGTSQLLSVPYALYAANAPTGATGATGATGDVGPTGAQGPTGIGAAPADTIGQAGYGGIIFYVDSSGHHGLVCALTDQSLAATWNNATVSGIFHGIDGDGQGAGEMNTTLIIAAQLNGEYAAKLCDRHMSTGNATVDRYGDWYLPSKWEMNRLLMSSVTVFPALNANGGTQLTLAPSGAYWTSTEIDATDAWCTSITGPFLNTFVAGNKSVLQLYVRAIRKY